MKEISTKECFFEHRFKLQSLNTKKNHTSTNPHVVTYRVHLAINFNFVGPLFSIFVINVLLPTTTITM